MVQHLSTEPLVFFLLLRSFEWVTEEQNANSLTEVQSCLTTKDTKSTKWSKDEALGSVVRLGAAVREVTAFDSSPRSILRVLCALRSQPIGPRV